VARFAIFDIDGVLADVRHRLSAIRSTPKNWDQFFAQAPDDPLLTQGRELLQEQLSLGRHVVYSTGRPERCRAATSDWLAAHELPAAQLFMRPDRDRRPGRLTKLAVARRLRDRRGVDLIVDDDPVVVDALRTDGFDVLHATWMGEPEPAEEADQQRAAQQLLFDLQADGYT
jgi:phosphoglycolate phosphatase-like HAD superfamily hydrolase